MKLGAFSVIAGATLAMSACIFPDMPTTQTPAPAEAPGEVSAGDGGVSVEELVAQVEKLQEMQRENERLKAKSERLKDELAELQEEARERRARHVEKFGPLESFAMLALAIGLAALTALRRRGQR
jgi:predicted RNase H-like nuclease (RuvC/YqgF family)